MSAFAQSQRKKEILDRFFERYDGPGFAVRLWDGCFWIAPGRGEPVCTLVLNSAAALQSLIARPTEIALGEAFWRRKLT